MNKLPQIVLLKLKKSQKCEKPSQEYIYYLSTASKRRYWKERKQREILNENAVLNHDNTLLTK